MPDLTDSEKAILQVVVSLADPSERDRFIAQACGSNAAMLSRMQKLVAADDVADGFLNPPADLLDVGDNDKALDEPSERIGNFKLLQKIGEGGFGDVYMAEQQGPLALKVALKVIKPGMDTNQVVARFDAERQALSRMDHPNIAKVFDGGVTEAGRPFFVMELVHGVSITEYCDQHQLTNQQRLSLFQDVCGAVQHAHQKGVIHRDLKPTNVLITVHDGKPVAKVIDFGIAKAIEGRLTDKTVFTRYEQFIGTPAYMSPEQAEMGGLDIDTRSDIYSLGALLYELLTGQVPFGSEAKSDAGYDILRQRIREQEPPTPSTRLSSLQQATLTKVAQNRHADPIDLPSLLRGELDWIVMKAMEKDRTRRYDTAAAFAEDIDRYLRNVPVRAVPPSKWYAFQKFARRNQTALGLAATIATILVMATVVSMWQAVRATRAEREQARLLFIVDTALDNQRMQKQAAEEAAELADAGWLMARQTAYASDMTAAYQALQLNNLGYARRLLDRNRPASGEPDLRNFEWRALWHQCQSDAISTFRHAERQITSMTVSPDGKWLATAQMGGGIQVWNIQTGKSEAILSTHNRSQATLPGQVVFAPTGDQLFTSTGDRTVKVWETTSWSETQGQFSHGAHIVSIRLSPDGTLLAISSGANGTITVWDVENPALRARMPSNQGDDAPLAISKDNRWLAIGQSNGSIRIVDLTTPEEEFLLPTTVAGDLAQALAFSPGGEILASAIGYTDTAINLWNVSERKLLDRLEGHTHYVRDLAFTADGSQLASASADQTIRLWDTQTWKDPEVLKGHQHEVWALAFVSDSDKLASGSKDGEICIWNTRRDADASWPITSPNALRSPANIIARQGQASFSPDGQWLGTLNQDGTVSLLAAQNLTETHRLTELGTNNRGLQFSPQQRLLVVADDTGLLTWLDPLGQHNQRLQRLSESAPVFPVNFSSDGKQLLAVVIRPDARCFVCAAEDSGEPISWSIPKDLTCAVLSPDGQLVVTGHGDGAIRFWQVSDPREPTVVRHRNLISGVAFSPDGSLLASGTHFGEARLWDVATRSAVANMHGHVTGIHAVGFTPDGKRLVTASGTPEESVKLWDLASRQEVATLQAPGIAFQNIECSPDGNAILVTSLRNRLSMWRVPSWEEIRSGKVGTLKVRINPSHKSAPPVAVATPISVAKSRKTERP